MRSHSQSLGIKRELYPLFACMLTGRPWESVIAGIDKTKQSLKEVSGNVNDKKRKNFNEKKNISRKKRYKTQPA